MIALPKKILFICVWNSCRSQMAEAFASFHGGGRIEAYSAGTKPSGKIDALTIRYMREVGYDLSQQLSKSLSQVPNIEYDVVVNMASADQLPKVTAKRTVHWEVQNPKKLSAEGFRRVRGFIEDKVKQLLSSLQT